MLRFAQVSKRFPGAAVPALDDVSFTIGRGRVCGLLGHNGAGKSTALGILLGMVHPDSGEVTIDGVSVQRERERAIARTGAIFEAPVFYEYLSGWRNLKVLTAYSGGVPESLMRETADWVGLADRIHDRVGTYSHGMRQRLALAQALLPRPDLLVLDEPTDGLDPGGIAEFQRRLIELRDRLGLTVLLCSHRLAEVEQVCDEVVILHRGRRVYAGSPGGEGEGRIRYRIESENPEATAAICRDLGGEGEGDLVSFPDSEKAADLLEAMMRRGARVSRFAAEEGTLESLYLRISGEVEELRG